MAALSMPTDGWLPPLASCAPSSRWTRTASTKCWPSAYEGKKFNSPNDIILGPDKRVVLHRSDPGSAERREAGTCLSRRLPPRRRRVGASADEGSGAAQRPGVLSRRQTPVHRRHQAAVIRVYDVQPNGELANGRLFGKEEGRGGVPDGMRVDVNGNVFVTGPGGIWVWDPTAIISGRSCCRNPPPTSIGATRTTARSTSRRARRSTA